jgi:ubiquinone/menaquinone biosynthesis C-methylase UbiE
LSDIPAHPQTAYFDRVSELLRAGMRWLDVGCGRQLVPAETLREHAAIEARLKACGSLLVGLDLHLAALRHNVACTYRVLGTVTALPFASQSYDLITANMVFEHLDHPLQALVEIRRVLRPGARLLVHTPNLFGIRSLVALAIPNRMHPWIVRRIEGRAECDVHPTHFTFNRRRQIERTLRAAGFARWRVEYVPSANFYGHLPLVGQVEATWQVLARRWSSLRPTLLVEAQAP